MCKGGVPGCKGGVPVCKGGVPGAGGCGVPGAGGLKDEVKSKVNGNVKAQCTKTRGYAVSAV